MKNTAKNLVSIAALTLSFFNSTIAKAQDHYKGDLANDPYYQVGQIKTEIKSVQETSVSPEEVQRLNVRDESFTLPIAPQAGADPMAIAQLLTTIWDIIVQGKPVANVQYKNATALPNVAEGKWEMLTGWKTQRTVVFSTSVTNLLGIKTVDLEYKVELLFGGSVNGKGRYVASARVVPSKVSVLWGYNLDLSVQVPVIVNIGSQDDPLAALRMDAIYKISTLVKSYSETQSYELHGDGFMAANGKEIYAATSR